MRLGVDIGGTFTDLCVLVGDQVAGIGKTLTTAEPAEGVERVIRETLDALELDAGAVVAGRPRHDARHQRDHRAQGRAHRAADDRRVPRRRSRSAASTASNSTTSMVELPDAARAAPPALRRARAHARRRHGRAGARRRPTSRASPASWPRTASTRSRSLPALATPTPPTSAPRAEAVRRVAPRPARLDLVRGRARDPRVRAHLDDDRARLRAGRSSRVPGELQQRLSASASPGGLRVMLSARRHRDARDGDALPGPAARVGPGGRRAGRRAVRRRGRPGGPALVRHGRHHGEARA